MAAWAVEAIGGRNIAGDADDTFHKLLMKEEVENNCLERVGNREREFSKRCSRV